MEVPFAFLFLVVVAAVVRCDKKRDEVEIEEETKDKNIMRAVVEVRLPH